jgi:hexosaminidase
MRRSIAHRFSILATATVLVTATAVLSTGSAGAVAAPSAAPSVLAAAAAVTPVNDVIPKPSNAVVGKGTYTLSKNARIVAGKSAAAVAKSLRADLRPATGFALPVVSGAPHDGDITLLLDTPAALAKDKSGESYVLEVTSRGVTITAATAHGLFNGVQTLRQLLPAWSASSTVRSGPWTIAATTITDSPRYAYRGVMLDIARHYESPEAAEQLVDQASAYKMNTFHLHLSDDQGFRVVINGFPKLTNIGAQASLGTDGRTSDPGGFWTQAQYRSFVAYAAAHFMTVVPEVDSPGHTNAIIKSEYGDFGNPYLNKHPQDINCSLNHPPVWNYTGDVGYSALCPESDNTWSILSAVVNQLSGMSSSPYYDLGGDETPANVLSEDRYAALVNREGRIVNGVGKTVMGWAEISGQGTKLAPGSVAEYWNPASGTDPDTASATNAVAKHMKIVMAPATHAYLDQRYTPTVPSTLGQTWACQQGCDVDQFYNWDPSTYVAGVTDHDVIGVEGAVWSETLRTMSEVDYMALPRMLALAELGWSPKVTRTATSPAYLDFLARLGDQGNRLQAAGLNFYPSTEVPWTTAVTAGAPKLDQERTIQGALATVAAPGRLTTDLTVTVDWGDGHHDPAVLAGTASTGTTVNGLYAVQGSHTYAHDGTHTVTITVAAKGVRSQSTSVTVHS